MISAKDKDSRKRGNMENNMSISEKELKLLLNFIKDDFLKKELFIQEDLNYKEDIAKINLYNTCEYISLSDKDFKVTKRVFSPGRPSMLTLYLEEA